MNLPGIFKAFLLTVAFTVMVLVSGAATYYSRATGNWDGAVWSTSPSGAAASATILLTDDIIIQTGNTITINVTAVCATLSISAPSTANGITISGTNSLTVTGAITMNAPSATVSATIAVNAGTLTAASIAIPGSTTVGRNCIVSLSTGTINVSGDISFTGTSGQARLTYTGSGRVNIGGTLGSGGTLTQSTGMVSFNGASVQTAPSNYTYYGIASNNSAGLSLGTAETITVLTIGDVTPNSVFNDGGFQLTCTGTLNLTSGTFKLGSSGTATTWPAFGTNNISGGTTIEYASGVNQTVSVTPTYSNLTFSGAGTKTTATALIVTGNFTASGGQWALANPQAFTLGGNYNSTVTLSNNNRLNLSLNGSGDQSVSNSVTPLTLRSLTINKPSGTATLGVNVTTANIAAGNLTVSAGTFDLSTFSLTSLGAGTMTISNGATMKIGGTNTLPTGFAAHSIGCTSTIEYSGGNQVVATLISSQTYGNLTLSGTGTKTLQSAITNICTNFTTAGSCTVAAVTGLTIGGSLDIQGTSTFNASTFTHNVTGNWTRTGTFTAGTSTIVFNSSSGAQSIGSSNFNNITFSNAGVKTATGALDIAGNVTINSNFTSGSFTHNVSGNWTNSGTFTSTGSTIDFDGSGTGTIGASNFQNITFSGSGTKTAAGILTISGDVSISNNFTAGIFNHTVAGSWTNSGTFTATGSTITFNGTGSQNIGTGNFNNINFINSGTKSATGALTIAGNVVITSNFTAGSYTHTVAENWTNNGTFIATGSTIVFDGSGAGNIGGSNFNNVSFSGSGTKTALGALSITGDVNITDNFLASGYTHDVSGDWTNSGTFNATGSTINFNSTNAQTINASGFYNMALSGSGTKTIGGVLSVGGTMTINSGVLADLSTFSSSAAALILGGANQSAGSWGSSSSPATYVNDTYFTPTAGVVNVGLPSAWTLSAWTYRKSHVINQTTGAGNDYQVMLTIYYGTGTDAGSNIYCGSNCKTDFGDIRFTDSNGNELFYWIQSNITSNNAVVWVKIPGDLSNSAQTIYMYYGNASATTTSNGPDTFVYFDDGNSSSSWTAGNPTTFDATNLGSSNALGNPVNAFRVISSGTGTGTGNTAQKYMYRSIPGFGPNTFTSFNTYTNTGNLGNLYFLCDPNGSGQMYRIETRASNFSGFASTTSWSIWTAPSAGFTASGNTWYKFGIAVTNSLGTSTTLSYQATTDNNPIPGATTLGTYASVNNGSYMGLGGDAVGGSLYTYMDNIITRKYVSPEPTQSAGSTQQLRYVWTHGTSTDWQVAGNWTPTRSTPATTDVLIFNENATLSVTNVPNQTIAELIFSNSTVVNLTSAAASNTLSVNNLLSVAAGSTFNLGTGVILSGTLTVVNNFGTIRTAVPTSTSTLPIPTGKTWSGTISYGAPAGSQTAVAGTYKNLTLANTSGSQSAAGALTVNGTLATTAGGRLNMVTYQLLGTLTVVANAGTIETQCIINPALPTGKTWNGIVNFNGTSAQTVPLATSYSTLKINNTAGVSLGVATTATNLTIGDVTSSSLFNDAGYQLTATGVLTQTSGTFKLGSVSSATSWSGFATNTLSAGTTVEYASGVAQNVSVSPAYQNLTFSGAGNKTAAAALTINGNVSINSGAFTAGSYTHTVGGNWTNSGTFTATGSTINFNGTGTGSIGASNFNNVAFSGAGVKTATGVLSIAGNVSITNNFTAGSYTHSVGGNWTNSGTFTAGTSTTSFTGTALQTIGGTSTTTFNNLTVINGSGGSITLSNAEIVSGTLTLTSGILTTTGVNLLSVTNSSSAAVTGGSGTAYINGPLKWTLPASLVSGSTYTFPLGKNSAYLPFVLVNPTTGTGVVTAQAEAFDANPGGTADGITLSSISNTEYWLLTTVGNFSNSSISLTRATAISPYDAIGGSSSAAGTYVSLSGTAGTYSVTNSTSIVSNRYFVFGRKNTISTSAVSPSTYCSGTAVLVPFTITGTYNPGNIFTAQLSDASGSFSSPVNIGSLTQTSAGTISATIPSNTTAGAGYRIRVVSSNPAVTGTDNGSNLTVYSTFTAGAINTTGETICYNGDPGTIGSATAASGGNGTITYNWQANGVDIASSNSATYNPPAGLTSTTIYTRWAHDVTCNASYTQSTGSWTVTVTPNNTITLTSANSTQTVCINTAIASITYTTTGATGATFSGLPTGVTGNWASNTVTINGTPSVSGTFNYTVITTGGCTRRSGRDRCRLARHLPRAVRPTSGTRRGGCLAGRFPRHPRPPGVGLHRIRRA